MTPSEPPGDGPAERPDRPVGPDLPVVPARWGAIRARVGGHHLQPLHAFCRQIITDQPQRPGAGLIEAVGFWVRVPYGSAFHRYVAAQSFKRRDHEVLVFDAGVTIRCGGQVHRQLQQVIDGSTYVDLYLTSVGGLTLLDPDAPEAEEEPAAEGPVVLPATILDAWEDTPAGDAP